MCQARLALFFLLLSLLEGLPPQASPVAGPATAAAATAAPTPAPLTRRERRRIAAILRLHLLELRAEGLERVRAAIERHLPVDALLAPPSSPSPASLH